ncbi:hypothetical protein [Devriesea agamarum]|uniref:hypothetical protein n=1 Tax=Devriesea agamarum TaxID=472569 RepID=UPI00071D93AD|nr:hypothetical protein [Devriesea agamarum]
MARRSRTLRQRIGNQLLFSIAVLTVLFFLLKFIGIRVTMPGLVLSIVITVALNVALSYWNVNRSPNRPRDEQR